MCLRFVFLLITRVAAWLRLSQRAEAWQTAEILILRHQLAVLQRRQPRPRTCELGGPGPARDPVPPGNSIASVNCPLGLRGGAEVVGWPGAAQDRLPADALAVQPGCRGGPRDRAKNAELLVLRHENAVLRRHAGRIRYDPADRAWFAALTRFIPRRRWAEVFPVTPATLLAWHRRLAARKYDTSTRHRPGRPATIRSIARLTVRLARENPL
jgi:hypothetical protein